MAEGPLFRAILAALVRGPDDRYGVALSDQLDLALERAVYGSTRVAELRDALRLIVALETRLDSPGAASTLRAWLRRSDRALAVIRREIAGGPSASFGWS